MIAEARERNCYGLVIVECHGKVFSLLNSRTPEGPAYRLNEWATFLATIPGQRVVEVIDLSRP